VPLPDGHYLDALPKLKKNIKIKIKKFLRGGAQ
jgi:hypothetical protein